MRSENSTDATRIWVGGYTSEMDGTADGIALLTVGNQGDLTYRGTVAVIASPSYLGIAHNVVYATGESGPTVSAFRREGTRLTPLGEQPAAGEYPCALAVVDSLLVVASYGDGAVGVHRLDTSGAPGAPAQVLHSTPHGDGVVPGGAHSAHVAAVAVQNGPHPAQDGPHAHDVLRVDATTILTTDLGTDTVFVHTLVTESVGGADAPLAPSLTRTAVIPLPAGTGPRDLLLRPSGDVWVLGELGCEIVVLRSQQGSYGVVARIPLPGARAGDHASAIAVNRAGTHAYVGLRGSNRISIVQVDVEAEALPAASISCGGDWPRHLVVVGEHLYVANQRSSTVAAFAIAADGSLVAEGSIAVPSPTYLLVD